MCVGSPILIQGETGVDPNDLARWPLSSQSQKPVVTFSMPFILVILVRLVTFPFASSFQNKTQLPATFIETPIPRLIRAITQSANHVGAVQCTKSCQYRPRASVIVYVHIKDQNWEFRTEFDHGMFVGLSIFESAIDRQGFSHTTVSKVYTGWCDKRKKQTMACL